MTDESDAAAMRARWLAEVGVALDEAQRLTARLAQSSLSTSSAMLLCLRIKAARAEVEALQRGRAAPEWSKAAPGRRDLRR